MAQTEIQLRRWAERATAALAWMRVHADLVMGATLLLVAAVWMAEHDARVRREVELTQVRQSVTQEVSALRRKADGAIQESKASEQMIRDLEARRTALERAASALRARLEHLRKEERAEVRPAAAPGHNELAGLADSRPDPARFGVRDSGLGIRGSGREKETGNWKLETGPSPAVSGQPSVRSERAARAMTNPESEIPNSKAAERTSKVQGLKSQFPEVRPHDGDLPVSNFQFPGSAIPSPSPEPQVPNPGLSACREQLGVQDQLIANCEERAELNRAALEAAKRAALELGEALQAKDQIAARLEERHRAELKLARGSRLRRFGRALQYVGVGVMIGVAIAQ